MFTHAKFVADVEAHLKATNTPPSTFGKIALGDPNFVSDLRRGRSPSVIVAERVYRFMERARRKSRVPGVHNREKGTGERT